jgi:hypothetical protein
MDRVKKLKITFLFNCELVFLLDAGHN